MAEREFWEGLDDEQREANSAGVPAYDAAEVAYLVAGMLDNSRIRVQRVLDLGCGLGRLTYELAWRHPHWTLHATDISRKMLSTLAAKRWTNNMRTHLGDGRNLPDVTSTGGLHGVYSVAMFQHIPVAAQRAYFMQVADRLFGGCRFVFTVALGDSEAFLNHRVDYAIVDGWCVDADMEMVDFIATDSRGWAWFVTERKRP